jgi:Coenzyme PQQ synthesis protein D (PqqD)
MNRLHRFPGIVVEEMDEEILLYRPTKHQAIHLNSMAAAIWKLCDGTRTMKDLIDCFVAAYPEAKSSISRDVQQTIDQLLRDGALIEHSPESGG